jgi:hypothetical protein
MVRDMIRGTLCRRGKCLLVDIAIPTDKNVLKYIEVLTEVQRMWNASVKVIIIFTRHHW